MVSWEETIGKDETQKTISYCEDWIRRSASWKNWYLWIDSNYYEATKDVMKESDFMKRYYIPEFEASRDDAANSKGHFIMTTDDVNK